MTLVFGSNEKWKTEMTEILKKSTQTKCRGFDLALVELHFQLPCSKADTTVVGEWCNQIVEYFGHWGSRQCFHEDVKLYLNAIDQQCKINTDRQPIFDMISAIEVAATGHKSTTDKINCDIINRICALHAVKVHLTDFAKMEESELRLWGQSLFELWQKWKEMSLEKWQEYQLSADVLLILAAQLKCYLAITMQSRGDMYCAISLLELVSPHNRGAQLWLIRLYSHPFVAALDKSMEWFEAVKIRSFLCESLGPMLLIPAAICGENTVVQKICGLLEDVRKEVKQTCLTHLATCLDRFNTGKVVEFAQFNQVMKRSRIIHFAEVEKCWCEVLDRPNKSPFSLSEYFSDILFPAYPFLANDFRWDTTQWIALDDTNTIAVFASDHDTTAMSQLKRFLVNPWFGYHTLHLSNDNDNSIYLWHMESVVVLIRSLHLSLKREKSLLHRELIQLQRLIRQSQKLSSKLEEKKDGQDEKGDEKFDSLDTIQWAQHLSETGITNDLATIYQIFVCHHLILDATSSSEKDLKVDHVKVVSALLAPTAHALEALAKRCCTTLLQEKFVDGAQTKFIWQTISQILFVSGVILRTWGELLPSEHELTTHVKEVNRVWTSGKEDIIQALKKYESWCQREIGEVKRIESMKWGPERIKAIEALLSAQDASHARHTDLQIISKIATSHKKTFKRFHTTISSF
ncbi:hypothetical protein RFI_28798 [Reticulomyxa filosa]|uniref:Uncharacterized protein n=1 Tax=Reticulomyxa filosa TaxID=46433 RepID=X6M3T4_RETFI|nr:hypothetical protein RFI_28798 [Reticulomyxa filosa]|eukprot:ETO08589.1 hypothetical protein RFI_28798 [Reticulomyxa filosa]